MTLTTECKKTSKPYCKKCYEEITKEMFDHKQLCEDCLFVETWGT